MFLNVFFFFIKLIELINLYIFTKERYDKTDKYKKFRDYTMLFNQKYVKLVYFEEYYTVLESWKSFGKR